MGTLAKANPSGENVKNMLAAGTIGASNALQVPFITVEMPFSTTGGTANADLLSWINPESGTIILTYFSYYFTTTGTGTIDAGVSSDGTGSNNNIIQAGTMSRLTTVTVSRRGRTGTEGAGSGGMAEGFVLGPGGTGTNNSIVAKTAETATTAVGRVFFQYILRS